MQISVWALLLVTDFSVYYFLMAHNTMHLAEFSILSIPSKGSIAFYIFF